MAYATVPRTLTLPPQCACCLAPTEHKVEIRDNGKTVGYNAATRTRKVLYQFAIVPQCEPCARRYANLGRYRAVVFVATLIAGYLVLVNSKYQHEHHTELLLGFVATVIAASLLAFLVGHAPTYRRAGHVPRCRIGWIESDGQLSLTNQEYARRALDGAARG